MKKVDYVYRNNDDTKRIRIYKQETQWDYDLFERNGNVTTFTTETGETFTTKRDTLAYVTSHYGKLTSLGNMETVTEGWNTVKCELCGERIPEDETVAELLIYVCIDCYEESFDGEEL